MQDRWDDAAAPGPEEAKRLEACVYGSRLLGAEPGLVLHGGGNTSVKVPARDLDGKPRELLWVKGSGYDLASITAGGFALLDLERVKALCRHDKLSDTEMMNGLMCMRLDASAPAPSVEAILHAVIPHAAVLHSHADAVLALTDTTDGDGLARAVFGAGVLVLPYVMPGFPLAKACAELIARELTDETVGIILLKHGIFTFGEDTRAAYKAMIDLVTRAEDYIAKRRRPRSDPGAPSAIDRREVAALRAEISRVAGRPFLLSRCTSAAANRLATDGRLQDAARRGPLTPDHVIRTKRSPLCGRDVAGYVQEYESTFEREASRHPEPLMMLDPAPRVVIDPSLGVWAAGRSVRDLGIARDIYLHTAGVIEDAEDLGGYRPVSAEDSFDMEYWELEQAKLVREPKARPHAGEVVLVTGSASGIGLAVANLLLDEGAAVVGVDLSPARPELASEAGFVGVVGDVCDPAVVEGALDVAVASFGGLDMLVTAAGIFGASERLVDISAESWQRTIDVNCVGTLLALQASHQLLRLSPMGGRVVVVGSKNVRAPGRGAGAYSASKAAVNQIARVAAIEWAPDGIRVNSVHPDGVFDTGLWTEELLAARAASYGLGIEDYKRRNLLGEEITSRDVAEVVVALCGPSFSKVTGAQVPIDGGNERVI